MLCVGIPCKRTHKLGGVANAGIFSTTTRPPSPLHSFVNPLCSVPPPPPHPPHSGVLQAISITVAAVVLLLSLVRVCVLCCVVCVVWCLCFAVLCLTRVVVICIVNWLCRVTLLHSSTATNEKCWGSY